MHNWILISVISLCHHLIYIHMQFHIIMRMQAIDLFKMSYERVENCVMKIIFSKGTSLLIWYMLQKLIYFVMPLPETMLNPSPLLEIYWRVAWWFSNTKVRYQDVHLTQSGWHKCLSYPSSGLVWWQKHWNLHNDLKDESSLQGISLCGLDL